MRDDAKACEAHPDRACPAGGDHWYEVAWPEDAGRWCFKCAECGHVSPNEVPKSMRKRGI